MCKCAIVSQTIFVGQRATGGGRVGGGTPSSWTHSVGQSVAARRAGLARPYFSFFGENWVNYV